MPGTSITGCQYHKTLVSHVTKKKKVILLLSTMHNSQLWVDGNTQKPVQIVVYNSTKGGVDTVDLMCSTYTTARKTKKRWPVVIFFQELDVAGINSLQNFLANNLEKNYSRRQYLFKLSMELMEENLKKRSELKSLPKRHWYFSL